MKFDIKNRVTGKVQFTSEINVNKNTLDKVKIGLAVKWALKAGADLRDADLRGACLRGAYLEGADLQGADLEDADLEGADLEDAKGLPPVPKIDDLDGQILAAIEAGGELDMKNWHGKNNEFCGTTHCRAGWAAHLAGEAGKSLEDAVGTRVAGALIYAASYPDLSVPDFYIDNETAIKDIKARAAHVVGVSIAAAIRKVKTDLYS